MKKEFLLSTAVLIIAFFHFNPFFELPSEGDPSDYKQELSVMSYNVRLFNAYEADKNPDVGTTFSKILSENSPDVVCVQEYYRNTDYSFPSYPYQFIHFKDGNNKLGHAILSKYPLVNTGEVKFQDSYNNAIFADLVKDSDTVRVYNLHLQSFGIQPSVGLLQEENNSRIRKRVSQAFIKQEAQVKQVINHKETTNLPAIVAGDFNNTPFSYVYRELKRSMNDSFLERGSGLGTTYTFGGYPMRIDYILCSKKFDVVNFSTIDESFSDHYPVFTTLGWN